MLLYHKVNEIANLGSRSSTFCRRGFCDLSYEYRTIYGSGFPAVVILNLFQDPVVISQLSLIT